MLVTNPVNGSTVFELTLGQKSLGGQVNTTDVDKALSKVGVTQIVRAQSLAITDEMKSFYELAKLESLQENGDDDDDDECD
ncbi:hypothetical protein KCU71_g833, partial [Aureobasidium melanogenum]